MAPGDPRRLRAAALLIGDELLTGKIRDENGWFLARFLRARGIELAEMAIVGDGADAIVAAVQRLTGGHDVVFTSGGVGPTHDDRTLEAVARATGRPLRRNAAMEALLREHYGPRITDAALSMADLPEGTEPCALPGWPVLRLALPKPRPCRLYILPGVPALFRSKLEALARIPGELPEDPGWVLETLDLAVDEHELSEPLADIAQRYPQVAIGSYPRWVRDERGSLCARVRVTFEAPVEQATAARAARDEVHDRFGDREVRDRPA